MTLTILGSSKNDPPQDRVDVMLRWLHDDIPEYKKSPTKPEFLEDRKWADAVIADLRKKNEIPGKAEAKKALEDMLPSIKSTAALYREKWFVLLSTTATADAEHTLKEKTEKWNDIWAKISRMTSTLEEIEKETQRAYDTVNAWCENRESRRMRGLYPQIIGPPDHELAEIAVTKFFERRGEISPNPNSNCFKFTQLLGEAVKDQCLSDFALLDAHRKAVAKLEAVAKARLPE